MRNTIEERRRLSRVRGRGIWILVGFVLGAVATGGLFSLLRGFAFGPGSPQPTLSPPSVLRQIQQLSQLVSVKYAVQQVVGFEEQKVPVGRENILLFVQAEVLAGIDLEKLTARDISFTAPGTLAVTLPPPRILHVVIDDKQTKVWDRKITWWTPWVPYNPDLERQARLSAREAVEKAALDMGILEAANRNAESAIRAMAASLGITKLTTTGAN